MAFWTIEVYGQDVNWRNGEKTNVGLFSSGSIHVTRDKATINTWLQIAGETSANSVLPVGSLPGDGAGLSRDRLGGVSTALQLVQACTFF